MRVLFLSNNPEVTNPVCLWLRQSEGSEHVKLWSGKPDLRLIGEELLGVDFIVSYNYNHVIRKDVLDLFCNRAINLHISFLPQNRGTSPNLWSFVEDTAKGVTIHRIDAGLDTGDILLQKECFFDEENETFVSTYNKLHHEMRTLFFDNWESLKFDRLPTIKQSSKEGSYHSRKDTCDFMRRHNIIWDENIAECKRRISLLGHLLSEEQNIGG
jgi:methionyl-tRNA formyltransferase